MVSEDSAGLCIQFLPAVQLMVFRRLQKLGQILGVLLENA
jgi:hypothetical protein